METKFFGEPLTDQDKVFFDLIMKKKQNVQYTVISMDFTTPCITGLLDFDLLMPSLKRMRGRTIEITNEKGLRSASSLLFKASECEDRKSVKLSFSKKLVDLLQEGTITWEMLMKR